MPEFINPYSGVTPDKKLSDSELARTLRLNLSAEEEAIHLYQAHADATENELARKVLLDIADEERIHAGEFQHLINILLKDEGNFLARGANEVNEMANETYPNAVKTARDEHVIKSINSIPAIGNLKQ